MSNKELEELYNKLAAIDQDLAAGLLKAKDPYQYLRDIEPSLEGNTDYTDIYSNLKDFIGDKATRLSKFYDSQDGKKPSAARMASFLEKNKDLTDKDVNDWFDKVNNYKEDYKKEREYLYQRNQRKKEVANLPWWKDVFTSDYSKQRYIDDPTTSILGGKQFNPYSKEGQSEVRDMILGTTAGIADVVPTPLLTNLWLGPAIRTGRDIQHEVNDETYKPEETSTLDYAKRFATDVGANTLFEYTPNWLARGAKRLNRGAGKELNKYVAQPYEAYKLGEEEKVIKSSYDKVNELLKGYQPPLERYNTAMKSSKPKNEFNKETYNEVNKMLSNNNLTPMEMYNEIKALPESEYKESLLRNINLKAGSIPDQIAQQQRLWEQQLNPQVQRNFATARNTGVDVKSVGPYAEEPSNFFYRKATLPELNKAQTIETILMKGGGKVGIPATKPLIRPSIKVTDEDRNQIDWFKANYARDWKLGFTPEYRPGDPKWIAFEEMYPDKAAEIIMKANEGK